MIRKTFIACVQALFLIAWCHLAVAQSNIVGGGVWGDAKASSGLMLDGITTGIKAAYSTRKLLTAYAGNALQIERLSDSTTQNVGFTANVLNTSAINTFCSGTTCVVITWYDQSGNGFDVTQGTAGSAPQVYVSGGVNFINSTRPALLWPVATTKRLTNASTTPNPTNTGFFNAVVAATGGVNSPVVGSSASNNLEWRVNSSTLFMQVLASATAALGTANIAQTSTGSVLELQYNSSTGTGSFWVDRAAANSFTAAHSFAGGSTLNIGADQGAAENMVGSIGEVVLYDLVGGIPTASRQSIENNQKAYWGTP